MHYEKRARHVAFSCPSINFHNRYWFDVGITFDGNDEFYDTRGIFRRYGLADETRNSFDLTDLPKKYAFDNFMKRLSSADILSMQIKPQLGLYSYIYDIISELPEQSSPIWISFSVKGASEAFAMLGKELQE